MVRQIVRPAFGYNKTEILMKIRASYLSAALVGTAFLSGVFLSHDNASKMNHSTRLQNMDYVKQNNKTKYIETLEIVNKSEAPRISPEYIDNIWMDKAKEVKDSIELSMKK